MAKKPLKKKQTNKDGSKSINLIECDEHNCHNKAVSKCDYCKRSFCSKHIKPTLPSVEKPMRYVTSEGIQKYDREDFERRHKVYEEWKGMTTIEREDGHPCIKYAEQYIKQRKEKKELELDEIRRAYSQIRPDKSSEMCEQHGCNNVSAITCRYCNKEFCTVHIKSTLSASKGYIDSLKDSLLKKEYLNDYHTGGGHPCVQYTEIRRDELAEEMKSTPVSDFLDKNLSLSNSDKISITNALSEDKNGTKIIVIAVAIIIIIIILIILF